MTELVSLRDARKGRGLSARQLSELSGISSGTIYGIEKEYTPYSVHCVTAESLADALNYDVSEINWPNGQSERGRPPHTGIAVTRKQTRIVKPEMCSMHFMELSVTGKCLFCENI